MGQNLNKTDSEKTDIIHGHGIVCIQLKAALTWDNIPVSVCDNKSASHWIKFDYIFHV